MLRLTEPTGSLGNLLDNVPLFAFSEYALPGFLFLDYAIPSTEVYAHILGTLPTSLTALTVALSPTLIPIVLGIIPSALLPTPFRLGSIPFATCHTASAIPGFLDRFVQSMLVSYSLLEFDRDIIAVFSLTRYGVTLDK